MNAVMIVIVNIVNEVDYQFDQPALEKYITYLNQQLENERLFSVVFISSTDIEGLNQEFRQKASPTDVLSFPSDEDDYLGDIIICPEILLKQANLYQHSELREFYFLLTHGFLHLNGYDHLTKEEEKEMFALQNELLNKYNITR